MHHDFTMGYLYSIMTSSCIEETQMNKLMGRLNLGMDRSLNILEKWYGLVALAAFAHMITSAFCYFSQNITLWPYNQIDWNLGMAGNYYLAILLVGVSYPYFWPRVSNRFAWLGFALVQGLLMWFVTMAHRDSFDHVMHNYPTSWVDLIVIFSSMLITVLLQIKGKRQ